MNDSEYKKLMEKLGKVLFKHGYVGDKKSLSDHIKITSKLDFDSMDMKTVYLVHTLLHLFYIIGSDLITKDEIVVLHNKVKLKFGHKRFDSLDEK